MELPTLYTTDKNGKSRFWQVKVSEDCVISKRYGQVGGKVVENLTTVKTGKNIGKSNETTPYQQACMMAQSLWKKQTDGGYSEEQSDSSLKLLPMLANKWDDKSHYIQEPFYIQPKLDGVRCIIGRYQNQMVMLSRTGKPVKHMDHILTEVEPFLTEGQFLDGENYSDELTFEEITGYCRTALDDSAQNKKLSKIKFYCFDFFQIDKMNLTFVERLDILKQFSSRMSHTKHIHFVPTTLETKHIKVPVWNQIFLTQGLEGVIVRDGRGLYKLNERSNHLLKFKSFQTAEYKIVDAEEATGKDAETVIWVCETSDRKRFNVRPRGTFQQRHDWFRSKHRYTQGDKVLTVQYQNMSENGIPRFPVGLAIRDYE